ncbi:MAG: hypothetical protein RL653_3480 [Pseudomonadota bacterium]|jgi:hypothetical protein
MPSFTEVNPQRSSAAFRGKVEAALRLLEKSGTPTARGTVEALRSGRVKVDGFSDLTRSDYRRLARELDPRGKVLTADAFESLGREGSRAHKLVDGAIYGYMWDDRVYVSTETSTRRLAATLVHEVNHVLNRSEENYRGAKAKLREEYRAHYAERVALGVEMTPERCRRLKQHIIREYALTGVTPADVADVPAGTWVPDGFGG